MKSIFRVGGPRAPASSSGGSSAPLQPLPPLSARRALIPSAQLHVAVEDELGSGRLGSVVGGSWLELPVAVKRVLPVAEERAAPGTRSLLEREVELLIPHLNHPAILPLYGVAELADGALGLVFKRGARGSLRAIVRAHRGAQPPGVPLAQALHLAKGICSALAYLHGQESPIVYGQLRPGNVIVSGDGNAMLDPEIGVIKEVLQRITSQQRLTASRSVSGAAVFDSAYYAPEVMQGWGAAAGAPPAAESGAGAGGGAGAGADAEVAHAHARHATPLDCAADVYSLGLVLLEMATCVAPFSAMKDDLAVYNAVVVERRRPEVPAAMHAPLAALVRRCLAEAPAARPTALEALHELARIEREAFGARRGPAACAPGAAGAAAAPPPAAAPEAGDSGGSKLRGLFAKPPG